LPCDPRGNAGCGHPVPGDRTFPRRPTPRDARCGRKAGLRRVSVGIVPVGLKRALSIAAWRCLGVRDVGSEMPVTAVNRRSGSVVPLRRERMSPLVTCRPGGSVGALQSSQGGVRVDQLSQFLRCARCGDRVGAYEPIWLEPADGSLVRSSYPNLGEAAGHDRSRLWHFDCLIPDAAGDPGLDCQRWSRAPAAAG